MRPSNPGFRISSDEPYPPPSNPKAADFSQRHEQDKRPRTLITPYTSHGQRTSTRVTFVNKLSGHDGIALHYKIMDPPSRSPEISVDSSTHVPTTLNLPFSTAETSPFKAGSLTLLHGKARQAGQVPAQTLDDRRPEDVLGQFSYAPATQTTTVVTTTTTITNLSPLRMKAPQHLYYLDPKLFPLAASPTPYSIKKLCFDVDGRPTLFQEADETLQTLEELKHQQRALTESEGTLRSVAQTDPGFETPKSGVTRMRGPSAYPYQQTPDTAPQSRRKRAASPVTISEAAALAGQQGSRKRRLVSGARTRSTIGNFEPSIRTRSRSRLQFMQTSTPITPHVDKDENTLSQKSLKWHSTKSQEHSFEDSGSGESTTTFGRQEDNDDDPQILSPKSDLAASISHREVDNDAQDEVETHSPWRGLGIGSALTPRMEQDGDDDFRQTRQPERPRPSALDTTAAQDVSLPSPSLSPVTAAPNMQSRRGYFEPSNPGQIIARGRSLDQYTQSQSSISTQPSHEPSQESQDADALELAPRVAPCTDGQMSSQSLMNIPSMVDTFEAMPEEMKSYLMYQFLRRCSKPVLHFVADVVNPALKCDFLRLLPVELGLNIIGNLDAKTLCCAAQVSKRWRELIDTSEKVWKSLFDADHYVLPEGDLQRAIHEGWGWQYASRPSESEKDLSAFSTNPSDTDPSVSSRVSGSRTSSFAALESGSTTPQTRRGKRKAKANSKPIGRKQQRRIEAPSIDSMDLDEEPLLDMASADNPYAAAYAAAVAVPYPPVGLPSLKNLHLFKSIYMRHHIIRKTWMQDEVSPRHIAFTAHQRHVVTCLQFDADKILTSSDDANINVYDTETGKLRQSLKGHEGGVWALQYQGNVLVSGSTDRTVRVWDIEKGVCTQIFHGHTSTVRCLEILMPTPVEKTADGYTMLPQQPLIITGSRDSNLRVWKLPKPGDPECFQTGPAPDEGSECPYYVRTLTGHHHSVRTIAAYADTLVSGSYDCSVRVWKISTGKSVHRLQGHTQQVYSVILDTKRNRCISGSMDNLVKVWSLDTGTVLFNLEGHSSLVGLLDLQLDRLVSAAADATLRIWDPENGHCRSTLSAHTGAITCFQHDGQKVISGSDRILKIWNVANGEFTKDLLTDLSGIWQVKFNERRCVAAVQRNNLTYIEVLDFGAAREGIPAHKRGKRIVVNINGEEVSDPHNPTAKADIMIED